MGGAGVEKHPKGAPNRGAGGATLNPGTCSEHVTLECMGPTYSILLTLAVQEREGFLWVLNNNKLGIGIVG